MADLEDLSVPRMKDATTPTWPNDKRMTVENSLHFAACVRRMVRLQRTLSESKMMIIFRQLTHPLKRMVLKLHKCLVGILLRLQIQLLKGIN